MCNSSLTKKEKSNAEPQNEYRKEGFCTLRTSEENVLEIFLGSLEKDSRDT